MKKGGFKAEMMVGFGSKKAISEDFCSLNPEFGSSVSVSGEDFFVDQLLNLNNEETPEEHNEETCQEDKDNNGVLNEEPAEEKEAQKSPEVSSFLCSSLETEQNRDDFGSVLSVPTEEADLEWLSHFVEESFSQFSTPYPPGLAPISDKPESKPEPDRKPGAPNGLNRSRRSKRARTGIRVWSTALAEPPSESSDSDHGSGRTKKWKRREAGSGSPRRCSHCGVQKTPQWRAGPLGAKTLCNACGVRFKSGRLLPEYRPACSPTFSSELHSNNHRKVLEMRKKKELSMMGSGRAEPGLSHPVSSFG